MNASQDNSGVIDQTEQQLLQPSPGEQLRAAREAQGLTIEQLALRLHMSRRHLIALEADDYQALPGVAYVRGYLRNLARELELDGDALVATYNQWVGEELVRPVTTINKVPAPADASHPLMKIVGVIVLVALVGSFVWWWKAQTVLPEITPPAQSVAVPDVPATPSPESAAPAPISAEADSRSAMVESDPQPEVTAITADGAAGSDSAPVSEEPEPTYLTDAQIAELAARLEAGQSAGQDEATGENLAEATAAVPEPQQAVVSETGEGLLRLVFSDDCWVTLKDADGVTRIARIAKAGETIELKVSSPAELVLGRASAVSEASFNGESLDVAAVARKNVARITLESN